MIVYKVVRVEFGRMFSSTIFDADACVEYCLGETTRPRIHGSCPMAFKTLNQARDFWFRRGPDEILRCEAAAFNSEEIGWNILGTVREAWKKKNRKRVSECYNMPLGTVLCSSITPVGKVE